MPRGSSGSKSNSSGSRSSSESKGSGSRGDSRSPADRYIQDGDSSLGYGPSDRFNGRPDSDSAADRYLRDGDPSLSEYKGSSSLPSSSKEDWGRAIACLSARALIDTLDLDLGGKLINAAIQGAFCDFSTPTGRRGHFDPRFFGYGIKTSISLSPLDLKSMPTSISPDPVPRIPSLYSEAASIISLYGSGSALSTSGSVQAGSASRGPGSIMQSILDARHDSEHAHNPIDRELALRNFIAMTDQEKALRAKEALQLHALQLNIQSASILADDPKKIAVEIANLKAFSKLLKDFCERPFSADHQAFASNAVKAIVNINTSLCNRLNALEVFEKDLRTKEALNHLTNHPRDIIVQLDNCKALIKLMNEFRQKPFSRDHNAFLSKASSDNLRQQ